MDQKWINIGPKMDLKWKKWKIFFTPLIDDGGVSHYQHGGW